MQISDIEDDCARQNIHDFSISRRVSKQTTKNFFFFSRKRTLLCTSVIGRALSYLIGLFLRTSSAVPRMTGLCAESVVAEIDVDLARKDVCEDGLSDFEWEAQEGALGWGHGDTERVEGVGYREGCASVWKRVGDWRGNGMVCKAGAVSVVMWGGSVVTVPRR